MTVAQGDLVLHKRAGGGGSGDPWQRDPERVARDVWNEKVSAGVAREHRGVVVDPESGRLDTAATAALRRTRP